MTNKLLLITAAILFALGLVACEQESPAERAAESVEEAGEDLQSAAEDVGNEVEDACEELKEGAGAQDTDC